MAPTIITTVIAPLAKSPFANGQLIDLIDLASLKDDLKITQSGDDGFLKREITRASSVAAKYTNRMLPDCAFQVQTYQDQAWARGSRILSSQLMPLQLGRWPLVGTPSQAGTAPMATAPVLSKVAGGSLAAATCFVRITYVTATGETAASLEASLAVPASNLLMVAAPPADVAAKAIGWNVYAYSSTAGGPETLQNGATPIAMGTAWTEPASGLVVGAALPQSILVIENTNVNNATNLPTALIEGVDFTADRRLAQLTRLTADGQPRHWSSVALLAQYSAGFATIPADVQEAIELMVQGRLFARTRDPALKQENVPGAYEANYWISAFMDQGAMTPQVTSILNEYRVPVIA